MPRTAKQYAERIEEMWSTADREGRDLTLEERSEMENLLEHTKSQHSLEKSMNDVQGVGGMPTVTAGGATHGGPGSKFIASRGYKSILDNRGETFSTGPVDVGSLQFKGTLTTNAGTAPTQASYQPGIVETLFQQLTVQDLFSTELTTASQVRYVEESTATDASNTVKEGAEKPESTLAFTEKTVPIRKVATVLPVSDEMLDDAPAIQSYLNSRLSLFIQRTEEAQLLRGNGTNPNIQGIVGASGVNTVSTSGTAGTAIAESFFNVLNNTRGSSLLDPTGIIVNPAEFAKMRLSKDGQGQFYGGGPFSGPYGNGVATTSGQFSTFSYWGVPVAVTTAIGAGTAVIGNFVDGARVYRRGGVTVEASNSHSDYWVKNLVSLRAESRLGLALFRPQAFTVVTLT